MAIITVMGVNTGEVLAEGTWEEVREIVNNYVVVPNKRLYTNYGFTDNNTNNIYVVD